MTVFERLQMPSLGVATEWLNSEPLGPAELRGHVVLVNFWTLTCVNWLRQKPYVRAWSQTYRNDGLVVIGVHTPEFSFEHELDRVQLRSSAPSCKHLQTAGRERASVPFRRTGPIRPNLLSSCALQWQETASANPLERLPKLGVAGSSPVVRFRKAPHMTPRSQVRH